MLNQNLADDHVFALRHSVTSKCAIARRSKAHSTAFEIGSMVPSINNACTTLPTTITQAKTTWIVRQTLSRSHWRLRNATLSAEANTAHRATTPQTEKGVGDRNRNASMTSGALVIHSPAT